MTRHDRPSPDQPESDRPELNDPLNAALESDKATEADAESAAAASDTFEQAADDLRGTSLEITEMAEGDGEPASEAQVQLERLQKILARSGIASRRHAEELITSGRVQVNGKIVTELGSKADPARDHIRVDGKLLQGSERHRYFMLNKPKGYVTTVRDPEGRPTIMEFFSKTRERLYPVGRLDYLSEGLLLVTNDGELANKLTRAASNVEKTYLVKVSGQPSQEDLERLRQGVPISKGKAGSARVQTAPAEIRPFRPGKSRNQRSSPSAENPWYEVVLIEGRNRELRKMFEEIGHHVEKIRRVGYGPLILDLEPGKIRELEAEEVENLRKAAEGKYRKPKPREDRKREPTPRPERFPSKPRWKEARFEAGSGRRQEREPLRDRGSRDAGRPARNSRRSFDQPPQTSDRRPERQEFRLGRSRDLNRESTRDSGRGESRANPRFADDRQKRRGGRVDRASRWDQGSGGNRGRFDERRPFPEEDRPKRFGSRPPRRDFGSPARLAGDRRQNPSRSENRPDQRFGATRPFRRDRPEDQPRVDRAASNNRGRLSRTDFRTPREDRSGNREDRPRFDRPRKEARSTWDREGRSERPDRNRRSEQRPSASRPGGNFGPGQRAGSSSGKQGSVRSGGGGRRPNSRPGGNRPKKRRP